MELRKGHYKLSDFRANKYLSEQRIIVLFSLAGPKSGEFLCLKWSYSTRRTLGIRKQSWILMYPKLVSLQRK